MCSAAEPTGVETRMLGAGMILAGVPEGGRSGESAKIVRRAAGDWQKFPTHVRERRNLPGMAASQSSAAPRYRQFSAFGCSVADSLPRRTAWQDYHDT